MCKRGDGPALVKDIADRSMLEHHEHLFWKTASEHYLRDLCVEVVRSHLVSG